MRKQSYNLILRWVAALALCAAALAAGALLSRQTAPGGGGVLISEVLASNSVCPAPDGAYPDFVELYNAGTRECDLSGCGLTDSARLVKYVFPEGTVLPAGAYLAVWCDAHAAADSGYAAFSVSRDGGETVSLLNRRGVAIDSVLTAATQKNQSMCREGDGWTISDRPTPGYENSDAGYAAYLAARGGAVSPVVISEFMSANSLYPLPDGTLEDWIELYNTGSGAADLSGCTLSDAEDKVKYVFPAGTTLEGGAYLLLPCGDGGLGFSLHSDGGETLSLLGADGQILDRVVTPALPKDSSYARVDGAWTVCAQASPGYENSEAGCAAYLAALGLDGDCAVRISELMAENRACLADASGAFPDWIELYNGAAAAQDLSGFWLSDDPEQPRKWRIPEGVSVGAESCLLIFCDGGDGVTNGEVHAGFSLSRYGESVTLSSPVGTEVDTQSFPALGPDRAWADGAVTDAPSPGYPNTAEGALAFLASRAPAGPLVISEVMSANRSCLRQYNGKFYDWAELKNISDQPVRLSDFTLTDDLDEPEQYRLPDKTLAPGALYVVLLSGGEEFPTNYDCAPFALNAEEDWLYLLGADGRPADYLRVAGLPDGGSIGRMDGEAGFFFFAGPTPERSNADGARGIAGAPSADPAPGVYADIDSATVTLTAAEGAEIRYTLDGSAPTRSSPLYDGPITLEKTAVLRARSFAPGAVPSETATFNYILGTDHTLPVVSLVAAPADLLYFADDFSEQERPANLSFFGPEGSFSADCGVALFGQTSRKSPKKSFKIQFRSGYDGELVYPIFGEDGPERYSSLVLRCGQDYPFAIIREELMTSLAADASDSVPVQAFRYCALYINGEYWGIYALKERFSEDYYAARERVSAESCTMVRATRVYEEAPDLFELMQFAASHDMTDGDNFRYIEENVDLESLADWLICEIYCGNSDIMNNVRYARSTENGGKWQHCFFDLDWTFLVHGNCLNYAMGRGFQYCKIPAALFRNREFRAYFLERLAMQLRGVFAEENVLRRIDELCDEIRDEVPREKQRWGGSVQNWEQNVQNIRDFITAPGRVKELIDDACFYLGVGPEEKEQYFAGLY